mgnify:CR=1 FL=1
MHRRLGVLAGVEAAAGALHDAAVGIREVVLCLVLGQGELALVVSASRWFVRISAALKVGIALALLQALTRCGDGCQLSIASRDLCRDDHCGFVLLSLVGLLCTLE